MFGLFKFGLRNTVVHDTCADPDISSVVSDLQTPYSDTTIKLAVYSQITDSSAVVAPFGFFKQTNKFHRFDLWSSGKCPHIHRGKIRT
jgi:hypothetical protein